MWFNRNKAYHDGLIPNVLVLAKSIKQIALEHYHAWSSVSLPVKEKWTPSPLPPLEGFFKIDFDTAIRPEFSVQAAVCRDSTGVIINVVSQINPPCDPTYGKTLAAHLACSLASNLKLQKFSLEGDSLVVIMAL